MEPNKRDPFAQNRGGQFPPKAEATGVVETVKEKAQDIASAAGEYADQAKEKVSEWASTAREKTRDAAHAAGDYAVQATERAGEFAHTAYDKTGDAMQDAAQEMTRMIRRYPIQSLLVGMALGMLLGRAASRS